MLAPKLEVYEDGSTSAGNILNQLEGRGEAAGYTRKTLIGFFENCLGNHAIGNQEKASIEVAIDLLVREKDERYDFPHGAFERSGLEQYDADIRENTVQTAIFIQSTLRKIHDKFLLNVADSSSEKVLSTLVDAEVTH